MERVLCDVEAFMADVSGALMRVYGNWLATLLAVRSILARYLGAEALRLARALDVLAVKSGAMIRTGPNAS